MPDYVFNLEALPPGEYKATISILKDGRKEIAVVTKTQPDAKIPLIQVPFVISHRPLYELPPHGDLIDRVAFREEMDNHYPFGRGTQRRHGEADAAKSTIINMLASAPVVVQANKEAPA